MKISSILSFVFLVVTSSSSFAGACEDACNRNYSTTPGEFQSCIAKCEGRDVVTPVVTDSSNEDKKDSSNPENSANPHRN